MKFKNLFKTISICLFLVAITIVLIFGVIHAPDQNPDNDQSASITDTSTQNSNDTTEEDKTIKAVSSATVTVVGDVLPHTNVYTAAYDSATKQYNFDPFFEYVSPYLTKADYSVANLEVTLAGTEDGRTYSGYPRFNCPDSIAASLKKAGFDLTMTANNHCFDTNLYGLQRTLRVLSNEGLNTLGTSYEKDAVKYLVKNINGIKIGMMSYTYETSDKYPDRPSINGILTSEDSVGLINSFDYNQLSKFYSELEENITAMKAEGAEAIVVYIHWGNEYQLTPANSQKNIAQKLCDLGVDVIVGGHPHVIQPMDLLESTVDPDHKTVCLYSTGNFLSNQRIQHMSLKTGHTEDGIMFSFTFTKYSDGTVMLQSTSALPTWVCLHTVNGKTVYSILPLDKSVEDWKTAYNISTENAANAAASYERTMALVGSGLTETNTYFQEKNTTWLNTVNSEN